MPFDDYYVREDRKLPRKDTIMDKGFGDQCQSDWENEGGATGCIAEPMSPAWPFDIRDEPLPDTNPKSISGVKKAPTLSVIPASAILVEGQVMALGASKYGRMNWREKSVAASVYIDAALRHIMDWNAGIDNDPESDVSHLGHVRACMGILIDAMENDCLIDDRPKDLATPRLLKQYQKN